MDTFKYIPASGSQLPQGSTKSPIKWAGGKAKVLPYLMPEFQTIKRGSTFHDIFGGSGVVAINIASSKRVLNDINPDLVNLYQDIRDYPLALTSEVAKLFVKENCNEETYYELREEFNSIKLATIRKSALFVYLNKHGFNGLCRYNPTDGKYNVSAGTPCKDGIPPTAPITEIQEMSKKLQRVVVKNVDFKQAIQGAKAGDVVYCDPPYLPLTQKTNFTAYAKQEFGINEQKELAACAQDASERGVKVVVSNHNTPAAIRLYQSHGASHFRQIEVQRSVGAGNNASKKAGEIIAVFNPR